MGTWGPGTFENDTALDALGYLIERLRRSINRNLQSARIDSSLERPVISLVACLRALTAAFEEARDCVDRQEVEVWQAEYLAWFNGNAANMEAEARFIAAQLANDANEFELLKSQLKH